MIRPEEIIYEVLTFKGFWKASLSDKAKWLVVWLVFAIFVAWNWIPYLIYKPIAYVTHLFRRKI